MAKIDALRTDTWEEYPELKTSKTSTINHIKTIGIPINNNELNETITPRKTPRKTTK